MNNIERVQRATPHRTVEIRRLVHAALKIILMADWGCNLKTVKNFHLALCILYLYNSTIFSSIIVIRYLLEREK